MMKIEFPLHNAYGIGGTIRSTANLSGALAAAGHDVQVTSVHRVAERQELPFDPRVRLHSLIEMRTDFPAHQGDHELNQLPNTMFPEKGVDFGRLHYTALHDQVIAEHLKESDADVVIATRPILNGYLRIGQEHLSPDAHSDQLRGDQNAAIATGLDAFVTVSEADAALYRAALPDVRAKILCIPNGVTAPAVRPSSLDSKVVVAAGRLVAVKRYDRLVAAFAKVSAEYPDWSLRLYGRGPERARLRRQIDELGLYNQVLLMGPAAPIETEWAKGAIAAVSSDMESFGMTIVEAMHCGVPVVTTDCPHGPAEIVSDGADGVLVPLEGGVEAYADALKSLMKDRDLRARLGVAARAKAATYVPSVIARRYLGLIEELRPALRPTTAPSRPRLAARIRTALTGPSHTTATPKPAPSPEPPLSPSPTASARITPTGDLAVVLAPATLPRGPLGLLLRKRDDYLALRTWLRPAHAEVDQVLIDETGATVTAHLLGNAQLPPEGTTVTLPPPPRIKPPTHPTHPRHHRAGPQPHPDPLPLHDPYAEAQTHHGTADHTIWDVHVHTTAGRIHLGRITGDTVERKKTDTYPATELPHAHPTTTTRLRPYYTATNALPLSARSVPYTQDAPGRASDLPDGGEST